MYCRCLEFTNGEMVVCILHRFDGLGAVRRHDGWSQVNIKQYWWRRGCRVGDTASTQHPAHPTNRSQRHGCCLPFDDNRDSRNARHVDRTAAAAMTRYKKKGRRCRGLVRLMKPGLQQWSYGTPGRRDALHTFSRLEREDRRTRRLSR